MNRLFRMSIITVLSACTLILIGGITRVSSSGLGCENDWPLCQGKPYPPFDAMAVIEYLHRIVAAVVAMLVVLTAVLAWTTAEVRPRARAAAVAAVGLISFQGVLGGVASQWNLPSQVASIHLALAVLFFAATILTALFAAADLGSPAWLASVADRNGNSERAYIRTVWIAAGITFALIVSGGVTSSSGSGLSCDAWPWCSGQEILPGSASSASWIDLSHRTVALIGTLTVGFVFWQTTRRPVSRAARRSVEVAMCLTLIQLLIGGAYVVTSGSKWLSTAHLLTAALLWGAMVVLAVAARQPAEEWQPALPAPELGFGTVLPGVGTVHMSAANREGLRDPIGMSGGAATASWSAMIAVPNFRKMLDTVNEYVALTKPGILTLLLATTLGGMLAGAAGLPSLWLITATLVGGTLSAGGANALNCYIDRDIDALMGRTKQRGTVTGKISPRAALVFGLTLTISAVLLFGFAVNWLASGLALLGNVYYVLVYTKWLKRRTPQNIVIGGAAGAMPPVVGWAAATGNVSVAAVLMFAIIYYWTPPHFWALALLKQGEYGRAAVPMMPNVRGEEETRWQVLLYTLMLAAVSLMLVPFGMGWIYLSGASVLNAIFVWYAVRLYRTPSKALARRMFFYSLWFLAFIFAAMVADRLILA